MHGYSGRRSQAARHLLPVASISQGARGNRHDPVRAGQLGVAAQLRDRLDRRGGVWFGNPPLPADHHAEVEVLPPLDAWDESDAGVPVRDDEAEGTDQQEEAEGRGLSGRAV